MQQLRRNSTSAKNTALRRKALNRMMMHCTPHGLTMMIIWYRSKRGMTEEISMLFMKSMVIRQSAVTIINGKKYILRQKNMHAKASRKERSLR